MLCEGKVSIRSNFAYVVQMCDVKLMVMSGLVSGIQYYFYEFLELDSSTGQWKISVNVHEECSWLKVQTINEDLNCQIQTGDQ